MSNQIGERLPEVGIINDAQAHSQLSKLGRHFLLHQVETHGNQGETHKQIERATHEFELGLSVRVVYGVARHIVAQAACTQCDETKVHAVQHGPLFERLE